MPVADPFDDLPDLADLEPEEFLLAVECPRCGHDADDHTELGCTICGCKGP